MSNTELPEGAWLSEHWPPGETETYVITEPDLADGGFTAYSPQTPGVVSDGDTRREAAEHYLDALRATEPDPALLARMTTIVEAVRWEVW